jgi:hypothetical protein
MKMRITECGCGCGGAAGGCQKPEGSMAKHDAMECAEDAQAIADMISDTDNLPEWLEAKITLAADYMNRVKDYLTHHMNKQGTMPGFGGDVMKPQFVPVGFGQHLRGIMKERIVKQGDVYAVKTSAGDRTLGTHPSKAAALKQLAAIEISKHKEKARKKKRK